MFRYRHFFPTIAMIVAVPFLTAFLSGCSSGDKADGKRMEVEKIPAIQPGTADVTLHPVHIPTPEQPRVRTGKFHANGTPKTIACGTCHATKEPNLQLTSGEALQEFHRGLKYAHGSLTCLSCHNPNDYDQLRLADGRSLPFQQSMTLCAQCHGPQHRDYQRGSHGGMTGFWDLTKGPRTRNHCMTCHDPHAPAYPQMMSVFKPLVTESPSNNDRSSKH